MSLFPRLPFIAIALTALAFIPGAQAAVHTIEADNGAVYEILWTSRPDASGTNGAHAQILTPDHEPIDFQFDCRGHMIVASGFNSSNLRTIPPRSVAGRIAEIACTGARVKNYSEPWHSADPRDKR